MTEMLDPYLWLEDIEDPRALTWVEHHKQDLQALTSKSEFETLQQQIEQALNANDNIPFPTGRQGMYYNLWRDAKNPRGLWRRTSPESYRTANPDWEILLDLDALAAAEQENWVWKHVEVCPQQPDRALIFLSRGGADAVVMREFDLQTRTFLPDGFQLPEAKQSASWKDADTLWFTSALSEAEKTAAGYPFITREWSRGTGFTEAKIIHSGEPTDAGAWTYNENTAGHHHQVIRQLVHFFDARLLLPWEGEVRVLNKPPRSEAFFFQDQVICWLRQPWTQGGQEFGAGSLLITSVQEALEGQPEYTLLFRPEEAMSVQNVTVTRQHVLVTVLHHVRSEVHAFSRTEGQWVTSRIPVPELAHIELWPEDREGSDAALMTVTGFLTPSTLYRLLPDGTQEILKSNPHYFDPTGLKVEQHFATSKDGTRIPYFQVAAEDLQLDGKNPTLLYGYGGFENARTPIYSASMGLGWLRKGGVYVLSNIRGGSEYGPAWHQAALRENRQRAFDDFIAIAEHLIERGVTSAEHLGVRGGSNGGLLTSVMLTQRPDLFKAVVSEVPLTDMQRYHKLLAGASWMAEYGNPETDDWNFIHKYSPYHNTRPASEQKYPRSLFLSSTRDDRVHPGHARKMVARLKEQGQDVLYYENTEGGHAGSANNRQMAHWQSLIYTFLWNELN
ncbi:prolyl oligopeptidase family serine peptidase [Deinococcus cellulosilyticus]|uniref:Prolyl oligopeptidase n=1 Tax=Deinococcus cellulosilyticus (strain DSM 18568 / NBRC 106333 / KACC 11606 / 5516J-15) TaxID=1223518 RepID=A0A511N4R0_DEIC1|nr:prolyl oligopeptidase family serine peptidase [Deinococcus cellulosilyticus]GEM47815.1 prolyl oligopeptidase [Deinococcus cellulosilyticus NBRC 106333 = KACC 11606]